MIAWVKSSEIYVCPDDSYKAVCTSGNSWTGQTVPNGLVLQPWGMTNGPWSSVDLKPLGVAANAKWAMIGGIGIITGAADIAWAFRAPGDISTGVLDARSYQQQLLSTKTDEGVRCSIFDLVPLINGCFEMAVQVARYPDTGIPFSIGELDGQAVGWNVKLKAWGV